MLSWDKTAFVFPGQASQHAGMGKDIATEYPVAMQVYEQADELLGFSLSTMCFDDPNNELDDTINTQIAMYVTSIAILRVIETEMPYAKPSCVAGHSLGEFTALTAAGSLRFEDGVKVVRERGRLMKKAGELSPGGMAAILGLSAETVAEMCSQATSETGEDIVIANDNCPGQIVISGDVQALERAIELLDEAGAIRSVVLPVSVAPHSPLMASVSDEFRQLLENTEFLPPEIPIYGNVGAEPLNHVDEIRRELDMQLTSSVRWTESVQAMIHTGVETFVEIGSKDVLSGLIRRIDRSKERIALNNVTILGEFLAENTQS